MENRAQFFALYLVFITLTMCGIVVGFYYLQQMQQDNVQSAIVSPMGVLRERDNLDIFERAEVELIYDSLDSSEGEFGSDAFLNSFRENFVDGIMNSKDMREFIFENLFVNGVELGAQNKNRNLIEEGVYSSGKSLFSDGKLIFTRAKISKSYSMATKDEKDKSKINFPVTFNFEFSRKYLIEKIDDNFEVSVA